VGQGVLAIPFWGLDHGQNTGPYDGFERFRQAGPSVQDVGQVRGNSLVHCATLPWKRRFRGPIRPYARLPLWVLRHKSLPTLVVEAPAGLADGLAIIDLFQQYLAHPFAAFPEPSRTAPASTPCGGGSCPDRRRPEAAHPTCRSRSPPRPKRKPEEIRRILLL